MALQLTYQRLSEVLGLSARPWVLHVLRGDLTDAQPELASEFRGAHMTRRGAMLLAREAGRRGFVSPPAAANDTNDDKSKSA